VSDRPNWFVPTGFAVIALVVAATAAGSVGVGLHGPALTAMLGLVGYVVVGLLFLLWRGAPVRVVAGLVMLLSLMSTVIHHADPDGPVVGLYLGMAFAPLRMPRRLAALACTGGVVIYVVGLFLLEPDAPLFALVVVGGAAMFFLLGTLLHTERALRARADQLLVELERSREAERAAAAVGERARLARELHDVLAHSLSGLVVHLDGLRMAAKAGDHPDLADALTRAHALAREGLDEARQAVSALRGQPTMGRSALPVLLHAHRSADTGECLLTESGEPADVSAEAGMALYRAAQEALSNVRKHQSGADVRLHVDWQPDQVVLTVTSLGGNVAASALSTPGFGLKGMAERAILLGGKAETGQVSADGRSGFRVKVRLPLDRAAVLVE
jgi:signal transduction histidine kinase